MFKNAYGKTWREFEEEDKNLAGTLIYIDHSYEKYDKTCTFHDFNVYLIGNINEQGGTSEEFMNFRADDIVVSYERIIDVEKIKKENDKELKF